MPTNLGMMDDTVILIIVLMGIIVVYWMGWTMGKSEYLNSQRKLKKIKTVEELQKELDYVLGIEDYERAVEINNELHKRLKKEK